MELLVAGIRLYLDLKHGLGRGRARLHFLVPQALRSVCLALGHPLFRQG